MGPQAGGWASGLSSQLSDLMLADWTLLPDLPLPHQSQSRCWAAPLNCQRPRALNPERGWGHQVGGAEGKAGSHPGWGHRSPRGHESRGLLTQVRHKASGPAPRGLERKPGGQAAVQHARPVLPTDIRSPPRILQVSFLLSSVRPSLLGGPAASQGPAVLHVAPGGPQAPPSCRGGSASLGSFRPGPWHRLTEGSGHRSAREAGPR